MGEVSAPQAVDVEPIASAPTEIAPEYVAEAAPAKPKRSRRKKSEEQVEEASPAIVEEFVSPETIAATAKDKEGAGEKPKRRSRAKATPAAPEAPVLERLAGSASSDAGEFDGEGEEGSRRSGWWQRTFGA
jgi:ribonuclease E